MRLAAVILAAALLVGVAPTAEGKRKRMRGTVTTAHGKAGKRWRVVPPVAAPTAVPTVEPTATATATPSATPTATPGSSLPPVNPRSVSVNSTEFAFTLSQTTVSAGEVRVQFDNSRAEDPHQLAIDGPDADDWLFDEVASREVAAYTVTMRPGRHVLVCPLPGHEQLGMRATLTVR